MLSDRKEEAREGAVDGAYEYLAEMILEVQQMALCIGAVEVSSHLGIAYVKAEGLRQGTMGRASDVSLGVRHQ